MFVYRNYDNWYEKSYFFEKYGPKIGFRVILGYTQKWPCLNFFGPKIHKKQNKIKRYIRFLDSDSRNIFPKFQPIPMYGFPRKFPFMSNFKILST